MDKAGAEVTSSETVARSIFKAAFDDSNRLRYPVGNDAKSFLFARRFMTESLSPLSRGGLFLAPDSGGV